MRANRGRKARLAQRAAVEQPFDPAPIGPEGGQYQPLSGSEVSDIYAAALQILDELGMGEVPKGLQDQCLAKGARINGHGRLSFSPEFTQSIVDGAAKSLVLHGRDPARSITAKPPPVPTQRGSPGTSARGWTNANTVGSGKAGCRPGSACPV